LLFELVHVCEVIEVLSRDFLVVGETLLVEVRLPGQALLNASCCSFR
jgi:hypothetical protein